MNDTWGGMSSQPLMVLISLACSILVSQAQFIIYVAISLRQHVVTPEPRFWLIKASGALTKPSLNSHVSLSLCVSHSKAVADHAVSVSLGCSEWLPLPHCHSGPLRWSRYLNQRLCTTDTINSHLPSLRGHLEAGRQLYSLLKLTSNLGFLTKQPGRVEL